jgi:hypothetical protein
MVFEGWTTEVDMNRAINGKEDIAAPRLHFLGLEIATSRGPTPSRAARPLVGSALAKCKTTLAKAGRRGS